MIRIRRMITHRLRWTLVLLAVAMGVLGAVPAVQAQVRRQSGDAGAAQIDPNTVQVMVDPLKAEVAALRIEVNRLHAALESLRLSVQANHAAYAAHRHSVAYYGVVSAKTISHEAPADVLVAITAQGVQKETLTGPAK
jgi:hypothetical protein